MSNSFCRVAARADAGMRLDAFVREHAPDAAFTRSYIQQIIEGGGVTVNGAPRQKNYRIKEGDTVTAAIPQPRRLDALPQEIALEVVYEDAWVIVINKPRGMVVHPAAGSPDHTVVNALLYHCGDSLSGINGVLRPGIVHRIDKDTSGLLVAAKNDEAHLSLAKQLEDHSMTRRYAAIVHGRMPKEEGAVDLPIGRSARNRVKYAVTQKNSKHAITHYSVLELLDAYTLVELRLETGRTHQIRVHMAHIGHPVAGDPVYGPKKGNGAHGQYLHAGVLGFRHPASGEYLEFSVLPPAEFISFYKKHGGGGFYHENA